MPWSEEASREAADHAKTRGWFEEGNKEIDGLIAGGEFPINQGRGPKIFESLRPVDGECSCHHDDGSGAIVKCSNTDLSMNSGMCTPCIFGCAA